MSQESERLLAMIIVLVERMTPLQVAGAQEQWELVCEQRGWPCSSASEAEAAAMDQVPRE
jgi:hypothetical protein